jgi:hypothetical protein
VPAAPPRHDDGAGSGLLAPLDPPAALGAEVVSVTTLADVTDAAGMTGRAVGAGGVLWWGIRSVGAGGAGAGYALM